VRISCPVCDVTLDQVEDLRTAYCRAGLYKHSCHRVCPVCGEDSSELVHQIPFADGYTQEVSVCTCGMGYASKTPTADYEQCSNYASPDSIGSGDTVRDRSRHTETVDIISQHFPDKSISILDIGCARGGLLSELRSRGYENAQGIDPSRDCVDACTAKGLVASQGRLEDEPQGQYDLVILSHVLEHVWDVPRAVKGILGRVKGSVYVEVPDAYLYEKYIVCPFLDFNREHINHFSSHHLSMAMKGFQVVISGTRELPIVGGKYPAIWGIYQLSSTWKSFSKESLRDSLKSYAEKCTKAMEVIGDRLKLDISGRDIAIWGYGEFSQQLFMTEAVQSARIVQIVDRSRGKQGKYFNGIKVESPENLRRDVPVLVASMLNKESIERDFYSLGFGNPLITIHL
jgi:2-polyprenyl-3-methyl-5-hydroxy-6-metoxy-1,4-benzoquinol methylase